MAKSKKIINTEHDNLVARVCDALNTKFPVFKFTTVPLASNPPSTDIFAEGPWELSANLRPAMGTMATFAEGYLYGLIDSQ